MLVAVGLAACGPDGAGLAATVEAEAAAGVAATQTAWPTAAPQETPTPYPTYTPLPTYTPQATATPYPTYTPFPTATAVATETPPPTETAVPTQTTSQSQPAATAVAAPPSDAQSTLLSALDSALNWLDLLTSTLDINFEGGAGVVISANNNVNCANFVHAFDQVRALPVIDVSGSDAVVQNNYNLYRAAIDKVTQNNDINAWTNACRAALASDQEGNLIPGDLQRALMRGTMDEAKGLLNQARNTLRES